ncbi:uncharacterized protein LOC131220471 [Magnolia sinica]|uniref:uncharacterized protein LOC131220471 n=1 Tax=Magnolia sinica TaxID=86752 RepID=UPI00265948D1|nr:uncharacterized protein LOC131220471 [Magnolia sinica]
MLLRTCPRLLTLLLFIKTIDHLHFQNLLLKIQAKFYREEIEREKKNTSLGMGNCLRHRSSMTCPSDDWDPEIESGGPYGLGGKMVGEMEKERLLDEKKRVPTTEVKIKLTKKQVDELLERVDIGGMSIQEVLAHLINGASESHLRHRSWRPALQSIPEVN